jgi:iron(III) transport system substrate-binding protein
MARDDGRYMPKRLSRRGFLRALTVGGGAAVLGACRPTTSGPMAPIPKTQPEGWDQVVEAARREGTLLVYGPPGPTYRPVLVNAFEKAYPGIKVDGVFGGGAENAQRLITERTAGRFIVDVLVSGPITPLTTLKEPGIIQPLRPVLALPEVLDESLWHQGRLWWVAAPEPYTVLQFSGQASTIATYNKTMVDPTQFKSYWDFLAPRWKGKIVSTDIRTAGPGASPAHFVYKNPALGPQFLERLFSELDVRLSTDQRQMVDWLAQGQYPIGLFVSGTEIRRAEAQGLPISVMPAEQFREGAALTAAFGSMSLIDRAPHPNAARVFVNWLLSRDGQQAWQRETETPSLRTDLPKEGIPDAPQPGVQYANAASEEYIRLQPSILRDLVTSALQKAGRS